MDITSALRLLAMLALLGGATRAMAGIVQALALTAGGAALPAIFEHPATIAHGIAEA